MADYPYFVWRAGGQVTYGKILNKSEEFISYDEKDTEFILTKVKVVSSSHGTL